MVIVSGRLIFSVLFLVSLAVFAAAEEGGEDAMPQVGGMDETTDLETASSLAAATGLEGEDEVLVGPSSSDAAPLEVVATSNPSLAQDSSSLEQVAADVSVATGGPATTQHDSEDESAA